MLAFITMPSTMEQHFYRDFDYSSPNGSHYRLWFENFDAPIDQYNRFRRLKVEVSTDGKLSWSSLPLALSLASTMRLWLSASPEWPPEIVVAFGGEQSAVWFDYEDDVDELRWWGSPSRWRASFDSRKRCWRLTRLYVLARGEQKIGTSTLSQ
jgi:hypothetical protein